MRASVHDIPALELALLRRGVSQRAAGLERCRHCHRTPLIGERIYVYESGALICELCRRRQRDAPEESRVVHGPEFGHSLKVTDQRAA
jgi:hypothetical protein